MSNAIFSGEIQTSDFNMRTVTISPPTPVFDADGEEIPLLVTRSRNSNGHASINLHFGKQVIQLNADLTPGYEQVTRMIAELLERAADHSCALPEVKS